MVIFYDKTSLEIIYTESQTIVPTLPAGTIEEKRIILGQHNLDFLGLEQEMGMEIYNYKVKLENEIATLILK